MKNRRATILVIEDTPQIRRLVSTALTANEYSVIQATTGESGVQKVASEHPDLVLLDLGLPDQEGSEVLKTIRATSAVPILIVSARHSEKEKVALLDAGADDYITKPFDMHELLARIRVGLRHAQAKQTGAAVMTFGALTVDLSQRTVTREGQEIVLSKKEYDLLHLLVSDAGKVLSTEHLLEELWGPMFADQLQYLRTYIGQLRQKLDPEGDGRDVIVTVPGEGYRFGA